LSILYQVVLEIETADKLGANKVHQHDSLWIEKVCEYVVVGKSNQQKGRHHQHAYVTIGD
jgi:pyruvate formate-lyase activating enzyme-like uncharacterized protein